MTLYSICLRRILHLRWVLHTGFGRDSGAVDFETLQKTAQRRGRPPGSKGSHMLRRHCREALAQENTLAVTPRPPKRVCGNTEDSSVKFSNHAGFFLQTSINHIWYISSCWQKFTRVTMQLQQYLFQFPSTQRTSDSCSPFVPNVLMLCVGWCTFADKMRNPRSPRGV